MPLRTFFVVQVMIDGVDVQALPMEELRANVAVVPQVVPLLTLNLAPQSFRTRSLLYVYSDFFCCR